jgi:acetyl-CoA C-acetyltransferase
MREVAIIGVGAEPVGEHWNLSLRELAGNAALSALEEVQVDHVDGLIVGNMMSGTANHQQQLGAYIADWVGLPMTDAFRVEAACSSGAAAFRSGVMAVASGEMESVLVVAAEKMTDSPAEEITSELSTAADADWEVEQGISFVGLNSLIMQRYMHEYGWEKEDFAGFSMNAHRNGVNNPNARFRKEISKETYLKATMVADPINIMDASPVGDGAASVLMISYDLAKQYFPNTPIIKVVASATATDSLAVHDRNDALWLKGAELSSKKAYQQAGIQPQDIDLFEAHDAFSIMAALSLEACGFAERGRAPELAKTGAIGIQGQIPIATMGGLKARGHPVGATGMYQIVEVVQQLRWAAGKNQVAEARIGMTQNIGGSGSNIFTHILQRIG